MDKLTEVREVKIKVVLMSVLAMMVLGGCGDAQQASLKNTDANTKQTTAKQSAADTTINPQVYLVCHNIYTQVKQAVKNNKETTFDSELNGITAIGQASKPSSPTGQLYEDASTVVALDDAMNSEGSPARAYDDLMQSLNKMKADLDKYSPPTVAQ
jgi:hypothetical protein